MATPTPSTNTPQKQLAALSSPAPRSVPPLNFDSPAMLTILGDGGVGMGISMSGMGMSQFGPSASQMGRADEDERRRRLESIIAMLKEKPGRVSEEGIIALCKKEGLEFERAVEPDGSVTLTLVIGNEAMCDISILGGHVRSVNLEIASDDDNIFKESGSRILYKSLTPRPGVNRINLSLDRFAQSLEKLLRMDKLSAENGSVAVYTAVFRVYTSLKKLFEHEKKMALALMDVNAPGARYKAEREVLCKKSGRPRINAGYCLGLSLEYWMDRRHLIPRRPSSASPSSKGKEKMDIDSDSADDYPEDTAPDTNKIYSLTIECEASSSSMYTPIRIPTSWISDAIEKAPDAPDADINNILLNTPQIDWLDPKPTYLAAPSTDHDDAMNLDNTPGRLPNIRFVAKFNPPLVVPITVYMSILQSVGLEYGQDFRPTTFVGLAIRPEEMDPGADHSSGPHTIEVRSSKTVLVMDKEGKEVQRTHSNSLYVPKLEYSRTLDSLPFQHPRQLVELLPTLRQYAFTTSLLQNTFASKGSAPQAQSAASSTLTPPLTPKPTAEESILQLDVTLSYTPPSPRLIFHIPHPHTTNPLPSLSPSAQSSLPTTAADLLAAFLSTIPSAPSHPFPLSHQPLKVVLDVLPNAELLIQEQNIVPMPSMHGKEGEGDVDMERMNEGSERVKRVSRALDVCGDLGVWGEWVRREVEKG